MVGKHLFTSLRVTSLIAALGLVGVPWGLPAGWGAGSDQRGMSPTAPSRGMARQAPTRGLTAGSVPLERSPETIDEYASFVQNRLQVEAMDLRQRGMAELELTIGKDGSIRQMEIQEVEGLPGGREQIRQLVNQVAPLPPLLGNADVLVLSTTLAFDYPGENLYDRFGFLRQPDPPREVVLGR